MTASAPRPLYIVLASPEHEKIQLAATMTAVAAVSRRDTNVMVSMNALQFFLKGLTPEQRYRGGELSIKLLEKNAPDAMELFRQGRKLGGSKMYACSLVMDLNEWELDDLEDGLFEESLGMTKFLSAAEQGELIVI